MHKRKIIIRLFCTALVFASVSCDLFSDDDNTENDSTMLKKVIRITDNVNAPSTWTAENIYVIEKYDMWITETLTINAGTIVKFHPENGPYMTIGENGKIIADGNSAHPIIFTSYYDDVNGGDTNGDGNLTSPSARNWDHIETNGEDGSVFNYCRFFYGGGGTYRFTLGVSSGSDNVTVTNCIFAHNDGSGYANDEWSGALDAAGGGSNTVIRNNIFYDNIQPLYIRDTFDLDNSNIFHNPDNAGQTNTRNGIYVYATTVTGTISWDETEVAFVINDVDWWIGDGTPQGAGTLDLGDDVVLKFKEDGALMMSEGSGVNNWWGSGVAFTSYKDDARKGDTNGDGSATGPLLQDWEGVYNDAVPDWIVSLWPIYFDSHD